MAELKRLTGENDEQYLWRIGNLIESGQAPHWRDISNIINEEFGLDEDDYRDESAYRKKYQAAKKFYENVFAEMVGENFSEDYEKQRQEIYKAKQKLADERCALNRILRDSSRNNENVEILKKTIEENGRTTLPPVKVNKTGSNDIVVCVSDVHLGLDTANGFGKYNSDIASKRMSEYIEYIKHYGDIYSAVNCYVLLLGDLVSGSIHLTTQLENRENAIRQTQLVSELVSSFVYELSTVFSSVFVNSVSGNHSRIGLKDQVLRNERLDDIALWYMKAKLSHLNNIYYLNEDNYDCTIGKVTVRNKEYWLVHGDYDSFSESGVSKLVMLLGKKPEGIFYGHLHTCSYDEISNVKIIRSGSFCGTSDDYTISKRLSGKPKQMICVVDNTGITGVFPVELH